MVRFFQNREDDVSQATTMEAIVERATQTARRFTPEQAAQLVQQFEYNPALPADVHLAVAELPGGASILDQVSMAVAASANAPQLGEAVMARANRGTAARALNWAGSNPVSSFVHDYALKPVAGNVPEPVRDTIKDVSRVGMAGLDLGQQGLQSSARTIYGDVRAWGQDAGAALGGDFSTPNMRERGLIDDDLNPFNNNVAGSSAILGPLAQLFGDDRVAEQTTFGQLRNAAVSNVMEGRALNDGMDDFGSGYFIREDSAIAQRRIEAERREGAVLANGDTFTIGRGIAHHFGFDQESTGYSALSGFVDAGVAIYAPGPEMAAGRLIRSAGAPVVRATGGSSLADINQAGGVNGLYNVVDVDKATRYFMSDQGTALAERFARMDSFAEIWDATRGKVDPYTVARLQDADNVDDVRRIMLASSQNGAQITMRNGVSRFIRGTRASDWWRNNVAGTVPGTAINLDDSRSAVTTILDHGSNIRAPRAVQSDWAERMARATNLSERYNVYTEILSETADRVTRGGIPADRARRLTRFAANEFDTNRIMFDEMVGFDVGNWNHVAIDGLDTTLPGVFMLAERVKVAPMPNARDLRRATSWQRPLWEAIEDPSVAQRLTNALGTPIAGGMDALGAMNRIWKDTRLMRGAYTVRVVGEEQIRMAAAGYHTLNHPLQYISRLVQGDVAIRGDMLDLNGRLLSESDDFAAAMSDSRSLSGLRDGPVRKVEGNLQRISRNADSEQFTRAWRDEVMTLASDPIAQRLSRTTIDEMINYLQMPEGRGLYEELIDLSRRSTDVPGRPPSSVTADQRTIDDLGRALVGNDGVYFWNLLRDELPELLDEILEESGSLRQFAEMLQTPVEPAFLSELGSVRNVVNDIFSEGDDYREAAEVLDMWREETAGPMFEFFTEADEFLRGRIGERLDSLREGRAAREGGRAGSSVVSTPAGLRDYITSLSRRIESTTGGNDDLLQVVRRGSWNDDIDLAGLADEFAPNEVIGRGLLDAGKVGMYDRATETFFEYFATRPTNTFSRSVVFRTAYTDRMAQLADLVADPDDLRRALRNAKMPDVDVERIMANARGGGTLRATHLDAIAKTGALEETKGLLYDLSRQGRFFETFRLLFPFGEAWKEVLTTWSRVGLTENPGSVLRQAGNIGQQGQETNPFDESDRGFFYQNRNGETVFAYPMTRQLSELFGAGPTRFEGRVSGLNLAGEVLPGLGPVAQLPAQQLIPNDQSFAWMRDIVFPFGEPTGPTDKRTWLPSWLSRALGADGGSTAEEQRLYGNTQFRTLTYLASTGEYDLSNPEERAALMADSQAMASRAFIVRGFVQFGAPSAPLPVEGVETADGLVDMHVLRERYNVLYEENPDTALEEFLAEVGPDLLLVTGSNTVATNHGGTPLTGEGFQWIEENPEVREQHPELYGFFAPIDPNGEFNFDAYRLSLENGERQVLDTDEKIGLAEHRLASSIYRRVRGSIEGNPNEAQTAILRDLRLQLQQDYPGYRTVTYGIGSTTPPWLVIDNGDVDDVLQNEAVLATPAGRGLEEYWGLRDEAVRHAGDNGLATSGQGGWRSSNDGLIYRQILWREGERIAASNPEFAVMWDEFLSREFTDPAEADE